MSVAELRNRIAQGSNLGNPGQGIVDNWTAQAQESFDSQYVPFAWDKYTNSNFHYDTSIYGKD